jgi:branched-chain amino acid transport system permease protein
MLTVYVENLFVTVSVFILLSWACYLPLRGGQLFNGPVYCAALSGYFAAYVTKILGWPVPIGFLGGVLFSGLIAFGLSFFLAPLTMFQMAVVTIALIFIVQTTLRNLDFVGGVIGMSGIPGITHIVLISILCVVVCLILLYRLNQSRWGKAMEAVERDRDVAASMGIDIIRMSIGIQTVSGLMGGLAGAIYTFNLGTVHPEIFGFGQLLYCFTIIMVGGRDTPWGMLFFAPILWLIPEFFPKVIAEFRNVVFGAIIIVFLLMKPKGVIDRHLVSTVMKAFSPKKG